MAEKIIVPTLGESVTEATVSKWLKSQGDVVIADEPIVELETDKVNLEVPSPIDGVLSEINSKNGETVEVGALLGAISQNGIQPSEKKIITNYIIHSQITYCAHFRCYIVEKRSHLKISRKKKFAILVVFFSRNSSQNFFLAILVKFFFSQSIFAILVNFFFSQF